MREVSVGPFWLLLNTKKESSKKLFCLISWKEFKLSHSVLYCAKQWS